MHGQINIKFSGTYFLLPFALYLQYSLNLRHLIARQTHWQCPTDSESCIRVLHIMVLCVMAPSSLIGGAHTVSMFKEDIESNIFLRQVGVWCVRISRQLAIAQKTTVSVLNAIKRWNIVLNLLCSVYATIRTGTPFIINKIPGFSQSHVKRELECHLKLISVHLSCSQCFLHSEDRASWYILTMKANEMHYFSNLFDKAVYIFRTCPLSIIRSISTLYTRNRYLSC